MVHNLILALTGRYSGRVCRRCSEPISRHDAFALSEGVCRSCSGA